MTSSRQCYFLKRCQSLTGDLRIHFPFTSFPVVPLVCLRQVSLFTWFRTIVHDHIDSHLFSRGRYKIQIDGSGTLIYINILVDYYWFFLVSTVLRHKICPSSQEISSRRRRSISIQGLDPSFHQIGSKHSVDVCLLRGKTFWMLKISAN
jgi:hypothetical protein